MNLVDVRTLVDLHIMELGVIDPFAVEGDERVGLFDGGGGGWGGES